MLFGRDQDQLLLRVAQVLHGSIGVPYSNGPLLVVDGRSAGLQLEKRFIVSRALLQYLPRGVVDGMCSVLVLEQALECSLVRQPEHRLPYSKHIVLSLPSDVQLLMVMWKRRSSTLAFRWGVHKEGNRLSLH